MDDTTKTNAQLFAELEEMQNQNMHIRDLIENSNVMLYRMSLPDGAYEYVSRSSSEILGYTPEEFYTSPLLIKKIIHPDCRDYFETQWRLLLDGNMPPTFEYKILHKSGETRWLNQRNSLVCDKNGKQIAITGCVTDTTDRRRFEMALKESEDKYRDLVETSQNIIFRCDTEGRFTFLNKAWEKTLGYSLDEMIGRKHTEFIPEKLVESASKEFNRILKEGSTKGFETQYLNKNGEEVTLIFNARTVHDSDGNITGTQGTAFDITDRKKAVEQLIASEEKFRSIFSNISNISVQGYDKDRNVIYWNNASEKLYGYTRDEALNKKLETLIIPPEMRAEVISAIDNWHENGIKIPNGELTLMKKDLSPVHVFSSHVMIENSAGEKEMFCIDIDLTERKKAEEDKARLEEQYRQAQKVESIGRLAGGMAHDLNNLLVPVIGYSEILVHDVIPSKKQREYADEILRAGYRARDLVHQLLAFSRKQILEYIPVNINASITGFKKLLRRTIRENIELEYFLSPDIKTVRADKGQIEQVIMNLCVNAQDAMHDGGKLTLETSNVTLDESYAAQHHGFEPGEYVMMAVNDTGCGMDEKTRKQIFEPFFSTKGELGTGMGLATVYGIVKQHGGNIRVNSEPGNGTTFQIYLPVSEDEHIVKKVRSKPAHGPHESKTILLVEDNVHVRHLASTVLIKYGYTVIVAENGTDALTALEANHDSVHLLLTDVVMPGMNGNDLFAEAVKKAPDIKVLFMSGYTDNIIVHHGVLNDGVQFIQKPFSPRTLLAKVREVLGQDSNNG